MHSHDLNNGGMPERAAFGLPHNYFTKKGPTVTATDGLEYVLDYKLEISGPNRNDMDRRASPLFFHIHRADSNHFIPVALFLPAQFLPENTNIQLLGSSNVKRNDKKNIKNGNLRWPPRSPIFSASKPYSFNPLVVTGLFDGAKTDMHILMVKM